MSERLRALPGGRTSAADLAASAPPAVGTPGVGTPAAGPSGRRERARHLWLVGRDRPVPLRSEPATLELPFPLPPLVEARRAPLLPLLVELAVVLAATAVGTGIATGADALAGPVDGRPAAYFLVLLALPLWELMPLPPLLRMGTAAAAWCAVASVWYLFAMASQDLWWRGEGAFGAACLVVGWAAVLAVWQFWVEPDVP